MALGVRVWKEVWEVNITTTAWDIATTWKDDGNKVLLGRAPILRLRRWWKGAGNLLVVF